MDPLSSYAPPLKASCSALISSLTDLVLLLATGEPADNAAHFVEWLTSLKGQELVNLRYAVFGCGHHDWARTYQRIPKLIDQQLGERGGRRLVARGEGDAGGSELFESFDAWETNLWNTLPDVSFSGRWSICTDIDTRTLQEYNTTVSETLSSGIVVQNVDEGTSRAVDLRQGDAALGTVIENRILTAPGAPEKRHIGTSIADQVLVPSVWY